MPIKSFKAGNNLNNDQEITQKQKPQFFEIKITAGKIIVLLLIFYIGYRMTYSYEKHQQQMIDKQNAW